MGYPKFLNQIQNEEQDFLKAPIYLYGTEAIGVYYKKFDLKNKSVLTVNGSGDQVLDAYYFGAKRVVGFDLVKNTKYMLDLKVAALKELDYKGFLDFFGDKSKLGNFNRETYSSLEKHLENETSKFFDNLFEKYNRDGKRLLESDNFRKRKEFYEKLEVINPFLANEENYLKMKKIISNKKIEFIESDIKDIYKKVDDKFDLINLSNVLNYVSKDYEKRGIKNPLEIIYRESIFNLKETLSKDGKIIFYAYYRAPEDISKMPLINRDSSSKWINSKRDFEVSKIEFDGILSGRDFITVLKNNK
ncbi:DUF3419 family protein [Candidatus Pacearchaeota archaeon]|nr:DUF3419 family protein [Candidatus Pacearchaeota archaeon]